jgi:arginase family enzyme
MPDDPAADQPAYVGIATFMRLPHVEDAAALRAARPDVAIVGAPTDAGTTYRPGARFGPRAIRNASYVRRSAHHLGLGVQPFQVLNVVDYGDAACIPGDIERTNEAIRAKVHEVVDANAIPVVLGGDHSVTFPSATAVAGALGRGKLGVLHFDAHADTAADSWGVLLSHGTPMRRLIESGAVAGRHFVQVGLRGYWPPPEVFGWMRQQGMRWHTAHDIQRRGFETVLQEAIEQALAAADIVELSPPYDSSEITAEVAHRLVLELLSALAAKRAAKKRS